MPELKDITKEILQDRRKNSFIRTGKRTNLDRRKYNRLFIDEEITINSNIKAKLINIVNFGLSISTDIKLSNNQCTINLSPCFDMILDSEVIWTEKNTENNTFIYGVNFIDLTEQQIKHLNEIIVLNNDFFIAHAKSINTKTKNIEAQNKIIDFFIKDVKTALKNYLKLDSMLQSNVDEIVIHNEYKKVLDELIEAGDVLDSYLNNVAIIKEIKQRVRALIGPFIYKSDIIKRSLEKPRGYPGDCELLELVYNNVEITTGFGKYLDRYYLNNPYAVAVRERKNKTKQVLLDFLNTYKKPTIDILNLASGSCREIRELLELPFNNNSEINFKCVDFDKEALEYSKNKLKDLDNKNLSINFINGNILDFKSFELKENQKFDLVYSIGIADYLKDRILEKILQDSFSLLKPGGKIVIGYKDKSKYNPIILNWYSDWYFIPRTEDEVVNIVHEALGKDSIEVNVERAGSKVIFFVSITKK